MPATGVLCETLGDDDHDELLNVNNLSTDENKTDTGSPQQTPKAARSNAFRCRLSCSHPAHQLSFELFF